MGNEALVSGKAVKYVDPDGRVVFLGGFTQMGGAWSAGAYEGGIAVSYSKDHGWQIGTFVTSGAGFLAGMGGSASFSLTIAPVAQQISDINGMVETLGGSVPTKTIVNIINPALASLIPKKATVGLDFNIPLNAPLKNSSITLSFGAGKGAFPIEGHMLTTQTTTNVLASGEDFFTVFEEAKENGLLDVVSKDRLDEFLAHFSEIYSIENNSFIED